jgi:hypothetical protein
MIAGVERDLIVIVDHGEEFEEDWLELEGGG